MAEIKDREAGSQLLGNLPKGCKLCTRGSKMVLFVTGKCNYKCFYCPISEKRRGGGTWANERPIKKDEEILDEAKRMKAEGASLTGGEPLLEIDKCVHYISLLKKTFGPHFHIHLYTYGKLATSSNLKKLHDAGLDEIRFHSNFDNLEKALKYDWDVGAEVPTLPGQEKQLKALIDRLSGKAYINLNELEFSGTNTDELFKQGFEAKDEWSYGVKGSEELALKLLDYAKSKNISVHYCSSRFKDSIQYRARLKRTAQNIKKIYEKVTTDGLLLKGVIKGKNLADLKQKLIKDLSISPDYISLDKTKKRLETSVSIAERAAKKGFEAAIIHEFPTSDRYESEYYPLENSK